MGWYLEYLESKDEVDKKIEDRIKVLHEMLDKYELLAREVKGSAFHYSMKALDVKREIEMLTKKMAA